MKSLTFALLLGIAVLAVAEPHLQPVRVLQDKAKKNDIVFVRKLPKVAPGTSLSAAYGQQEAPKVQETPMLKRSALSQIVGSIVPPAMPPPAAAAAPAAPAAAAAPETPAHSLVSTQNKASAATALLSALAAAIPDSNSGRTIEDLIKGPESPASVQSIDVNSLLKQLSANKEEVVTLLRDFLDGKNTVHPAAKSALLTLLAAIAKNPRTPDRYLLRGYSGDMPKFPDWAPGVEPLERGSQCWFSAYRCYSYVINEISKCPDNKSALGATCTGRKWTDFHGCLTRDNMVSQNPVCLNSIMRCNAQAGAALSKGIIRNSDTGVPALVTDWKAIRAHCTPVDLVKEALKPEDPSPAPAAAPADSQ